MIINAAILAFRQIRRNFARSFLTMLGIIIGVSSVVVMISVGNGTSKNITDQISVLGSNVLMVMPARGLDTGGISRSRRFSVAEANAIKERVPRLKAVAPVASSSVVMKYSRQSAQTQVVGTTEDYFTVGNWEIASGRAFNTREYRTGANVCVLGESVRKSLFKDESPLGARIKTGPMVCECVGVLESKGQGGMGNDMDDVVLMPIKTFQRGISLSKDLNNIGMLMISVEDGADSRTASGEVAAVLRDIRNIKNSERDTFEIMDTRQIRETVSATTRVLTLFLGAIAGVSLIVGGIGIMNIMLVSVTERTREIGTRLAIGALEKEVLLQFLVESVTISSVGGLIGIVISFFVSLGASKLLNIPFVYNVSVAVGAFIFSAFIGVLFGYLPAKRASRLNPIDALRHE